MISRFLLDLRGVNLARRNAVGHPYAAPGVLSAVQNIGAPLRTGTPDPGNNHDGSEDEGGDDVQVSYDPLSAGILDVSDESIDSVGSLTHYAD